MKTTLIKTIAALTLISQVALAQSQITSGVNFFRKNTSFIPIRVAVAEVNGRSQHYDLMNYLKANRLQLSLTHVMNGGLTYMAAVHFMSDPGYGLSDRKFTGEINLESCVKENGQNVFGQFKSLEEVLKYSQESNSSTQFSSCQFSGRALFSDYTTPNSTQPRDTMENVKILIFADHVEITAELKGTLSDFAKFKSPFLYYNAKATNEQSLANAREETLSILQNALNTLQGEMSDKQLPKTVAYILANRETLQSILRSVEGQTLNNYELIEFSVSVKNAFHILDQAVGLASNKQIQMSQLIQINN